MNWALVIAAIVAADLVVATLLIRFVVRRNWDPIAAAHPAVPPREGAVRRPFQSFRIGLLNLGGCVHVTVDDDHLHLDPARFIRWFGAEPASVPWSAITILRRHARRRWTRARLASGPVLDGPAWCLDLADPSA